MFYIWKLSKMGCFTWDTYLELMFRAVSGFASSVCYIMYGKKIEVVLKKLLEEITWVFSA